LRPNLKKLGCYSISCVGTTLMSVQLENSALSVIEVLKHKGIKISDESVIIFNVFNWIISLGLIRMESLSKGDNGFHEGDGYAS